METLENNNSRRTAPQHYAIPVVEMLEVVVERGFATTDQPEDNPAQLSNPTPSIWG